MVNNELLMEAYNTVFNINESVAEILSSESEGFYPAELATDGWSVGIEFLGFRIWDDNNEEREFIEEKNEYEPLEPFIRKLINQKLELIKNIKL